MAVTLDKEGNYVSMERFMPSYKFSNPMDMEFADNGDLYMLEYGPDGLRAMMMQGWSGLNTMAATGNPSLNCRQIKWVAPFHLQLIFHQKEPKMPMAIH